MSVAMFISRVASMLGSPYCGQSCRRVNRRTDTMHAACGRAASLAEAGIEEVPEPVT